MTYYHLPTSTVRHPGRLETKLSDGALLGPPDTGWTPELAALCGFVTVVETAAPAVTASQVAESTVTLPGGIPTRTWTVRSKTQPELDADTATANSVTVHNRAETGLAVNSAFLAISSPSNAQTLAQVKALTRQVSGLIRLTLGKLDDITGTG